MWLKVRDEVCDDGERFHEDQDLSLHIVGKGGRIIRDNQLIISTRGQSLVYWPKLWRYIKSHWHTKLVHWRFGTISSQKTRRMPHWQSVIVQTAMFIPALLFGFVSLLIWPFQRNYHPDKR